MQTESKAQIRRIWAQPGFHSLCEFTKPTETFPCEAGHCKEVFLVWVGKSTDSDVAVSDSCGIKWTVLCVRYHVIAV